jgi:hypothetical protein
MAAPKPKKPRPSSSSANAPPWTRSLKKGGGVKKGRGLSQARAPMMRSIAPTLAG